MDAAPAVKRLRTSSSSYNERQRPLRSLVSLPVELVTCIIDQVEDSRDYLALSKTCRALYRPCSLRALVARFGRGRGLDGKLYCLNPSYLVGIGLWPFAIIGAQWVDQGQDVALEVVEFGLDALKETPDHLGLHLTFFWTEDGVSLKGDCNCWRYGRTATLLRWNSMARGRLAVMTSALMDERFECPECGDTREVETGSDLASRWRFLTHDLDPIDLPCPRCTVTYRVAHEIMRREAREIALAEATSESGAYDEYVEAFQRTEESPLVSPTEDSDAQPLSPSSASSSDWDDSDEAGKAEESDSNIDEPLTEQDELSREFEASLRALAETWSVDDSDDSQSTCSSALSLDNSDDSDNEATSAEDEGPLDMIDLRAEAEAVQRAFEDEADEKCRYDQKLAASDEQEPDWWFPYGFPPGEWEWLEGYGPMFSEDEWSGEWRERRQREYHDDWRSDRASSSDGGEGPGQRYDGELGWTGGKHERDEGWYDAQEDRGTYWW